MQAGLLEAVRVVNDDAQLSAAVIVGAGSMFVAGSDLREFGQPPQDPQLPTVIETIEQYGKPVIAALKGAALGSGFELELGCDGRIASPNTVVGLSEVSLGMIPGAGGSGGRSSPGEISAAAGGAIRRGRSLQALNDCFQPLHFMSTKAVWGPERRFATFGSGRSRGFRPGRPLPPAIRSLSPNLDFLDDVGEDQVLKVDR